MLEDMRMIKIFKSVINYVYLGAQIKRMQNQVEFFSFLARLQNISVFFWGGEGGVTVVKFWHLKLYRRYSYILLQMFLNSSKSIFLTRNRKIFRHLSVWSHQYRRTFESLHKISRKFGYSFTIAICVFQYTELLTGVDWS